MKNMKVLTGTMLTLILSGVSVSPALSRPVAPVGESQFISQTNPAMVRGTIQSIRNNQVSIRLPNGETQIVEISEDERNRLGLLPGMEIEVVLDDTGMMGTEVTVLNPNDRVTTTSTSTTTTTAPTTTTTTTTTARTIRVAGDIVSCEDTSLQVRLPDGGIRTYMVGPDVCSQAVITPGRRIEFDIDDRNMVSNIQQPVRALW
ncbi:hypothetical protein [Laspinema olomoucense]|uniref:DUF5666 domain-containing protein n=1 Tax=Laspinema olomoucense D3b TaxID=2953688 RepID=A0ABT2N587_9CYAN|nr:MULTISPECIES: hypothetical protein [unclassified Laspinema]MCT7973124.1 hypothetical protein [Laspinema sp. D3d]MCT7977823.1 hypothetical protein [Laspinema sp. D3b]MCT7990589.1 hypothetical protein [Laspinema sp. D3a]MCT7994162.1 hypothetical protein [Laspinema sp. D3c]